MSLRPFIAAALICAWPMASYGQTVQPVQGTGKAGSPATGVVSVQGVSNGTPMPVTGTLSVAGAADTVGSTLTLAILNDAVSVATAGQGGCGVHVGSGLTATLTPEITFTADGSSGWVASTFSDGTATKALSGSAADLGIALVGGVRACRVRISTAGSGSASAFAIATVAATPGSSGGGGGTVTQGPAGASAWLVTGTGGTFPVTGTFWQATQPVSGPLTDTQLRASAVPVSGTFWQATQPVSGTFFQATQPVSIASMPSTPVTGTFWQATQPVSGTVTANAGSGTFTNQQSNKTADYDTGAGTDTVTMFGVALPKSGGAVAGGTSTDPLRVDPTGGTTQPVSGTVSAAQSGTWTVQPGNTANTTAWKVDGSAVTQPVSGTVTTSPPSNASTNVTQWSGTAAVTGSGTATGALRVELPTNGTGVVGLNAGSAIVGKVGIDQTTPGTTNGMQINAALPAGTNVIGHVINDSGSTTAVTGNVTVVQPTGTNLHAVLDTTSTTAVTQATGTNLHAVIDTGSTTAVTQATGTNLHAVIDSGSTTAATQATAANLNATVTQGPAGASAWKVDGTGGSFPISGSISNTTFTATQGTGSNLHTVTDSGSVTSATIATDSVGLAKESGGNLATIASSGATAANQTTGNTTLTTISGKLTDAPAASSADNESATSRLSADSLQRLLDPSQPAGSRLVAQTGSVTGGANVIVTNSPRAKVQLDAFSSSPTNPLWVRKSNGLGPSQEATVEAPNGVASATDRALTVGLSPNSPVPLLAATTVPTAVADKAAVRQMGDKLGRAMVGRVDRALITSSGVITLTNGTETTLLAAAGAGYFLDLIYFHCENTSVAAVRVDIRDATGGTVRDAIECPAASMTCGGYVNSLAPIPQTTANNNWTVQLSGAVTDVRCVAYAEKTQ